MNRRSTHRYEFDSFYLDPGERLLLRDGQPIPLTPKVLDTLVVLVENAGHLVLKDELMNAVWPDSFVEEINLSRNISELRKALGETVHEQRYVVTVPGSGYRFAAQVREITDPGKEGSKLLVSQSTRSRLVVEHEEEQAGAGALPVARAQSGLQLVERRIAKSWKVVISIGLVAIAVGAFLHSRRGRVLNQRDTIVLADFDNKTGDPVFDDTLKQALAAGLQQSPFLHVLSDQRVGEILRLMAHSPRDPLNPETARDLCQRAHSKAVLFGSIASLGGHYAIGLNAMNCVSGDSLDSEEVEASRKEEVLNALNEATTRLRRKLGESLISIQKFDVRLDAVTTPSLDALKAWTTATMTRSDKGEAAAVPLLKHAIALDPDFAMAYAELATVYVNLQQPVLAAASMKKAYELRDRASQWEKFYIESHYYHFVTGQLDKAIEVYDVWSHTYPWDSASLVNLGGVYESLGQFERAIAATKEAIRRDNNEFANSNLVALYADMNRMEEAWDIHRRAQERKAETPPVHVALYSIASLQGNTDEMARQEALIDGTAGLEDRLRSVQAANEAFHGRLNKARELTRRAVESARSGEDNEAAALWQINGALREAEFGNWGRAHQEAAVALALSPTRDVEAHAALVLAQVGDPSRAQTIAEDLAHRFPLDTLTNVYWLPTIRAAIQLSRNNPEKALDLLQATAPYELGVMPSTADGASALHPVYVRSQAYLMLRRGAEAAAEYQKFLNHRGLVRNCVPGAALAYFGLARAYALQHDSRKARAAYQDFLTLWKDADPDIPILKQAKAEYAKLQ
jgi:DNA-binding winged helix-turn-helix (wHTH) protein/tetratricopeptide (TPR) repeat protein